MVNNQPIKRTDLRPCALCKKGLMSGGTVDIYAIAFEQHIINPAAVQREMGLENFFGGGQAGATLAVAMGTNSDMTAVTQRKEVLICQGCMMNGRIADLFYQMEVEETDLPDEGLDVKG